MTDSKKKGTRRGTIVDSGAQKYARESDQDHDEDGESGEDSAPVYVT